jgi:ribose transport system ATP-binding protein
MKDEGAAILRADGLSKRFGTVTVLNGIALDVRAGEVHAIIGENGAGKSTLMRLLRATSRQVRAPFGLTASRLTSRAPPPRNARASPWCTRRFCSPMV